MKFIEMINGENSDFQKIVEINAGAAIYLSGISNNLTDGFKLAKNVIDKKISKNYFQKLIN